MKTIDKVREIAQAIRRAGGRAMMVGGCVRDMLLNTPVKDFDLEIYGLSAAELLTAVSGICEVDAVGMSFGVLKVKHHEIDLALPRKENKTGRGHKGFIMEFSPELDFSAAASRRDFTINAIMMDAITGEIIDPWGGKADLQKKRLRHVSDAFTEDPLRVLRGMQFISRFGLSAASETIELCSTLSQDELPPERVAAEWEKMLLKGEFIADGLNFLRQTGWVKFYPELNALIGCQQNPQWHPEGDVWNHTLGVVHAAAAFRKNSDDDLILMLSALCHDFGKPACSVTESDGRITSCGHDTFTGPAEKFITSIWRRKDLPEKVIPLIACHMQPWQLSERNSSDKAFRKLALRAKRLDLLADLTQADVLGTGMSENDRQKSLQMIAIFRERCRQLAIADQIPKPLILGRHLLERGFSPGPALKPILDRCFEAQISGEFNDIVSALIYLDKILCEK